jgi:hypothetical protein
LERRTIVEYKMASKEMMEEFADIIKRHGFWRGDFGEQQIQQVLIGDGKKPPLKVGTIAAKAKG